MLFFSCYLHLQGLEAGPPRHWNLEQGHEHHELIRQRHLRENRKRSLKAVQPQRPLDHLKSRGTNFGTPSFAW